MPQDMKNCKRCKQLKSLEEYYPRSKNKDGRDGVCKECTLTRHREYGRTHKFDRYGITNEQYQEMLKSQNGTCKICKGPETMKGRSLAVDHCHTTGQVRGLLCGKCNQGLGSFRDSPELLGSAVQYIESSRKKIDE